MQAGDYLLQNFAIFVNLGETDSPLPEALEMILLFESEMEKHADLDPSGPFLPLTSSKLRPDGCHALLLLTLAKKARLQWGGIPNFRDFFHTNSACV
ncbi:MAG: hypothetical protein ACLTDV_13320 [Eubacterium sp.]